MKRTGVPEKRIATDARLEVRTSPDGKVGLRGYAAVFDSPSNGEVIHRAAFKRTLKAGDNVRLLVNHEGVPLASTGSGTMTLSVDERGLLVDVPDLDMANPTVQELVSAMARGDITQMSFAGIFLDVRKVNGLDEVREVALWDVSVVTFPWYEDTEVALKTARRSRAGATLTEPEHREIVMAGFAARMAPAGKYSWWDRLYDVWEAIEEQTGTWVSLSDIGDDWVVWTSWADCDACYLATWSIDAATGEIVIGAATLVVPTYVPAGDPAAAATDEPDPVTEPRSFTVAEARALLAPAIPAVA